jgi:hypothetical protein
MVEDIASSSDVVLGINVSLLLVGLAKLLVAYGMR